MKQQGTSRARRFAAVAALVVLLSPAAAAVPALAQSASALTVEERAWLDAHGPVRYAPDPSYPPFESVDATGNVTGINVDLLNRMSRNLDFHYEIVLYPNWTAVLEAFRRGEVDLLGSTGRTDERETYMDFIGPYMQVGEVFYVRDDGPPFATPADLSGHRVGVIENYAAGLWLAENRPDVERVSYPDMESGLAALSVGDIDAFFENIPVGGYYIRQNALTNIHILGEPQYYSDANWVVPENETVLYAIVGKGMASIPLGEQTRVFEFWTGYDLGVARAAPAAGISPLARNLLVGLLGLVVVAGTWSILLRRTVRAQTAELRENKERLEAANLRLEHDIRLREAAEAEVRRLNADLESRVEARTRELEAFTYTVSHDLRTPLTTLRTYSHVLSKKYGERLDDDGRRYLERMLESTRRMARLLDDVLKLSRATRRPIASGPVDLSRVVHDSIETLRAQEPERQVRVTVREGALVEGDADLLRLAVDNLVGNAWKYTRRSADPRIEFGWDDTAEGRAFFVSDNGAGFDADDARRLFQPFERLHEDREFEGTGIGLTTVARVIERHGGKVWAEGRLGEGATFRFILGAPA